MRLKKVGYQDTSNVAKKVEKLYRNIIESKNWPMGNFIHNGSEITTWMVYRFKTKSIKSKATFSRKELCFESHAADY